MRTGRSIDWRLRSHLAALLVVTMVLTFTLVVGAMVALHLPSLEREGWEAQQYEVDEMQVRTESVMQARRGRLALLEARLDETPPERTNELLDAGGGGAGGWRGPSATAACCG